MFHFLTLFSFLYPSVFGPSFPHPGSTVPHITTALAKMFHWPWLLPVFLAFVHFSDPVALTSPPIHHLCFGCFFTYTNCLPHKLHKPYFYSVLSLPFPVATIRYRDRNGFPLAGPTVSRLDHTVPHPVIFSLILLTPTQAVLSLTRLRTVTVANSLTLALLSVIQNLMPVSARIFLTLASLSLFLAYI